MLLASPRRLLVPGRQSHSLIENGLACIFLALAARELPMDPKCEEVTPAVFLRAVDDERFVTRVERSPDFPSGSRGEVTDGSQG